MPDVARIALMALVYAALGVGTGYLSVRPAYRYADPDAAQIKVSFSHAAERVEPCRELSPAEIAELAPNMRQAMVCERERLPLVVELDIDGERVYAETVEPSGLWDDGAASVYARLPVAPGEHRIAIRLRDSARGDGWDYTGAADMGFVAGHNYTVTFDAEAGGFEFR